MAEATAGGAPAIVLDAAVMLKAGWDRLCDAVWFVDVPRAKRVERARERGWTETVFAAREAAQESLEEKRRCATAVIDNSGSPDQTAQQVRALWGQLEPSVRAADPKRAD
jgi:dephospho-CoA kinase